MTVTAAAVPPPVRAERALVFRFELRANGIAFEIDLVALGRGRTKVLLTAAGPKGSTGSSLLAPFARLLVCSRTGSPPPSRREVTAFP